MFLFVTGILAVDEGIVLQFEIGSYLPCIFRFVIREQYFLRLLLQGADPVRELSSKKN